MHVIGVHFSQLSPFYMEISMLNSINIEPKLDNVLHIQNLPSVGRNLKFPTISKLLARTKPFSASLKENKKVKGSQPARRC